MVAAASAQAAAITGDEAQDPVLWAYQRNQTVEAREQADQQQSSRHFSLWQKQSAAEQHAFAPRLIILVCFGAHGSVIDANAPLSPFT
jgi:hypothetical protein